MRAIGLLSSRDTDTTKDDDERKTTRLSLRWFEADLTTSDSTSKRITERPRRYEIEGAS